MAKYVRGQRRSGPVGLHLNNRTSLLARPNFAHVRACSGRACDPVLLPAGVSYA